jgi:Animal haem peroxidase/RTX calcium-binding nonapeptide repeat (4 copies)
MATSFNINRNDLEFILRQIKIAELHAGTNGTPTTLLDAIAQEYGISETNAALSPFGLRTVDGSENNLLAGQADLGAADTLFPRLTDPVYLNDADGDVMSFGPTGSGAPPPVTNNNYGLFTSSVADADPRIISNLIADQSISNPAAVKAYLSNAIAVAQFTERYPGKTPVAPGDPLASSNPASYKEITNEDLLVIPNISPDVGLSPGFNSWMTIFGQFFDHGLDLVSKGGNGTVYIPLQADDPLIAGKDGILVDDPGTATDESADNLPPHLRFMALTRATVKGYDANGNPLHENTTTAFVDQNQTYTSHSSHQVFLREYAFSAATTVGGPKDSRAISTGKFLDGMDATGSHDGAVATWKDIKNQAKTMLGLSLSDFSVGNVPLLKTDQYGRFIPGANGYAQVTVEVQIINNLTGKPIVDGTGKPVTAGAPFFMEGIAGGLDLSNLAVPGGLPSLPVGQSYKTVVVGTGHAFLDDIAHHAAPGINRATGLQQAADADIDANGNGVYDAGIDTLTDVNGDGFVTTADFFADDKLGSTYDNEMLDSHFITGDGRGNENIGLTAVHSVFHSEHNRTVEVNKITILSSGDLGFINEWLITDLADTTGIPTDPATLATYAKTLNWDGERLFQAARFTTEMQYQHLVFEEFARRIEGGIQPFVFTNSANIDPSIVAEFAHVVYRFGHSMLTGTVDRLENDLTTVNGEPTQETLLNAFLNPQLYNASGATIEEINANLARGLTRDVGNEIDEFLVSDLRNNLVGLPLDLAALNLARGRETGVPSLNNVRAQLYNDFNHADLKPYTSWRDFMLNIKTPLSVVNFIAAYGTHSSITSATTLAAKRDAATALVFGGSGAPTDRNDFMNGKNAYASNLGGLNNVDMWIGGLAEKKQEFGGMLGSTFTFVFQYQMQQLQNGDRFYYLSRTQGTNLLNQLEPNTFTDIVMRNTELSGDYATHLNASLFTSPDYILELDRQIAQTDYNPDQPNSIPVNRAEWDPQQDDPDLIMAGIDKVERDYTTTTQDVNGHDVGGYLKFNGGEHVVLGGTEGNDTLIGGIGDDAIWGDGGNDLIEAGHGSDHVFGGKGDDIITDGLGDDFLRGGQGNDVIASGKGIDLLFGEQGHDYLIVGNDGIGEIFAGEGNDFLLGGTGADGLMGNEGDDWIEGGEGFDAVTGENSELFFNSPIIGHDVLWGQGNDTDYDGESGDDIMFSGDGIQRMNGMWGFDWGIAKFDKSAVNFDLSLGEAVPIVGGQPNVTLRDRFDLVEAASGWKNNDVIVGDNRTNTVGGSETDFENHALDQAGVDRIQGLQGWFGGARQTLFNLGAITDANIFRNGNILMGGGGSDRLSGRSGFDLLDGDAWLNVRIKIDMGGGTFYYAESMNTDKTVTANDVAANAGLVTNAAGVVQFLDSKGKGRSLNSLMLDRTLNPGQLSIVREILTSGVPNVDTAVFQGNLAQYAIEGRVTDSNGIVTQQAFDANDDGFIAVSHLANGIDDTDLVKNIEILEFADGIVDLSPVAIENAGAINLFRIANQYVAFDSINNTSAKLTYNGQHFAANQFPGWSVISAEKTSTGELQSVWKHTNGQFWYSTDSNTGGLINPISKEIDFQQDFNGDGHIGGYLVENAPNTTLRVSNAGEYVANNGGADINLKYGGVNFGPDTFKGWSIIGAEIDASNDVKQVWKNTEGVFWYSTNTNTGNPIANIIPIEVEFSQDFNGDGHIGGFTVEGAGTTMLRVNNAGEYVANNGSGDLNLQYNGVNVGPSTYRGWSVVGAEISGGDLKQIWKSTGGQFWSSSNTDNGGLVLDILPAESTFGQDFNSDGVVTRITTAGVDTFNFGGVALTGTVTQQLGVSSINNFNNAAGAAGDKLFFSSPNTFALTPNAAGHINSSDFAIVNFASDTLVTGASSAKIIYNVGTGSIFYNEDASALGFGTHGGQFAVLQNKPATLDINNILVGP